MSTWDFLYDHLAEVAGDVGQQVAPRVPDLVHELLRRRAEGDEAASAGGFRENEGAVRGAFHHGEAHHIPGENQRQQLRETSSGIRNVRPGGHMLPLSYVYYHEMNYEIWRNFLLNLKKLK